MRVTPIRIGEIMIMIRTLAMTYSKQRENIEKFEPSVSSTTWMSELSLDTI